MKILFTLLLLLSSLFAFGQSTISGTLQENDGAPVVFANIALYDSATEELTKVETTDENGAFKMLNIVDGNYYLLASYIGLEDIRQELEISGQGEIDLGVLSFGIGGIELSETIVTASRVMVEVKPDRTVFNVDGTINAAGSDAIELLRKAPGVTVDNNENINVLGRAGVLLYVDGKRIPIAGDELTNYLRNLSAEQIDKIDIISNPGAKYEAEGNAGIIDIKLKKAENVGANGTVSMNASQGKKFRGNTRFNGNVRTEKFNLFGNVGYNDNNGFNDINFNSTQNGLRLVESNNMNWSGSGFDFRIGGDYYLSDKHTIGVLASGGQFDNENLNNNRIAIGLQSSTTIDSILIAENVSLNDRTRNTYNLNYRYDTKNGTTLNVDLDYGSYDSEATLEQPNQYYDAAEEVVLTEVVNRYDTPSDIDISTLKIDFETQVVGGTLGAGTKLSNVVSDNTFLVYNVHGGESIRNDNNSNRFKYDEMVYAGYVSFARPLGDRWNMSLGLRGEQTKATGDLQAFNPDLTEPPVEIDYLSWFPNAGLTFTLNPTNTFNLNYGRRINRPDYNVLNPFNFQLSEISYEKGNPFLNPEIVNNVELGYTLMYRYNFKLSYSFTTNQITRLIAPDEFDPRANFISWDNLAEQSVWSFNASAPVDLSTKWNVYSNLSISHLDNQADYGDGAVVDVQAWSYSIYQQHTLTLPGGFKGEVSGYFAGPGVWGGVFEYDTSWALNFGVQKKFLQDQLNVKLSFNDVFYQSGWSGVSRFDGLVSSGSGNWDSRRASLSMSYNFGNQKIQSRQRKTGLEDEASRVGQ